MLQGRTLRRYVAKRFAFAILGAFSVCAVLIFMIDMVELLRLSRRASDLSLASLLWMGLLRLPAFLTRARQAGVMPGDVKDGLALTGYFLETRVFQPRGDPVPEARRRIVEVLGRLE